MQMKKQRERGPGLSPYAQKLRREKTYPNGARPRVETPAPAPAKAPPPQKEPPAQAADLPTYLEDEVRCTVASWKGSYVIVRVISSTELLFLHMNALSGEAWSRLTDLRKAGTPIELMCAAPVGEIPPGKKFRATSSARFTD